MGIIFFLEQELSVNIFILKPLLQIYERAKSLSLSLSLSLSQTHTHTHKHKFLVVGCFMRDLIHCAYNITFHEIDFDFLDLFVFLEGFTKMGKLFLWMTLWIMVEIFHTCWDLIVLKCKSLWGFMLQSIGLYILFFSWIEENSSDFHVMHVVNREAFYHANFSFFS